MDSGCRSIVHGNDIDRPHVDTFHQPIIVSQAIWAPVMLLDISQSWFSVQMAKILQINNHYNLDW